MRRRLRSKNLPGLLSWWAPEEVQQLGTHMDGKNDPWISFLGGSVVVTVAPVMVTTSDHHGTPRFLLLLRQSELSD